jgi:acyl-CoA synthetase (AMP-forming)/AMP-acid ligase II
MDVWNLIPWANERHGNTLSVVDLSAGGARCPEQAGIFTYSQFTTSCAQLAAHLWSERAMRRGIRVGVMLRNSVEVLQAHFAAAATHSIVVNINVGLTAPELEHVLTDSGCQILIVDTEFRSTVSTAAVNLILTNTANDATSASQSLKTLIWVVKPNVSSDSLSLKDLTLHLRGVTNVMFRGLLYLATYSIRDDGMPL